MYDLAINQFGHFSATRHRFSDNWKMEGQQAHFGFAWVRNPALDLPLDLLTPFLYSLLFALAHVLLVKYVFTPYSLRILPPPVEKQPIVDDAEVNPKLKKRGPGRPRKVIVPDPPVDHNAKKREKVWVEDTLIHPHIVHHIVLEVHGIHIRRNPRRLRALPPAMGLNPTRLDVRLASPRHDASRKNLL